MRLLNERGKVLLQGHFPSFSEGLSLRPMSIPMGAPENGVFPFLFGGAFIEALSTFSLSMRPINFPSFSEGLSLRLSVPVSARVQCHNFPSFSEGLSLRLVSPHGRPGIYPRFPFLFGGAFIEAEILIDTLLGAVAFPFLFGGAFIEARMLLSRSGMASRFPFLFGGAFIEALTITITHISAGAFPFLFGGAFIEA